MVFLDQKKLLASLTIISYDIKPHSDYASVMWDGCSDVLKKGSNFLQRRAVKLIFPDTTLTTDQKLKKDESSESTQTPEMQQRSVQVHCP